MRYFKENRRKKFSNSVQKLIHQGTRQSSVQSIQSDWLLGVSTASLKRELKYSFARPTRPQHIADLAPGPGSKHTKTPPIHQLLTSIITTLENNIRKFPTQKNCLAAYIIKNSELRPKLSFLTNAAVNIFLFYNFCVNIEVKIKQRIRFNGSRKTEYFCQ